MKQSLQLKITQQLNMTPQLQQAIKLLQLSTLDLEAEIQKKLETNVMLELVDDNINSPNENSNFNSNLHINSNNDLKKLQGDCIPNDLPVDTKWSDIYQEDYYPKRHFDHNNENFDIEKTFVAAKTLKDHLHFQLQHRKISKTDLLIAEVIIDNLDDGGYLTHTVDEICSSLKDKYEIEADEVMAVLHKIQHLEPLGSGAKDLRECLLIQLNSLPKIKESKYVEKAKLLVTNYLDLLANGNIARLIGRLGLRNGELPEILKIIRGLHPKPGDLINNNHADYIVPDVIVVKNNNRWLVELNSALIKKIRINKGYMKAAKKAKNENESKFLQEQLHEAKWFLNSVKNRHETLLRVATSIVKNQKEFLEEGMVKIKPLILQEIASELNLHESTISRVTTNKYIHTPYGVFELKYFFSSSVNTNTGGKCSSKAISALIKKLIDGEESSQPLSDLKISQILANKGYIVARRTVAKYREGMKILSSNRRRKKTIMYAVKK